MTRFQLFLSLVIVLEAVGVFQLWRRYNRLAPLPITDAEHVFSEAIVDDLLKMEAELDRSNPVDWLKAAETYKALGIYPPAEYCFQQAHRLSPPDQEYLFYWANCLSRMGKLDAAGEKFAQVLGGNTPHASFCWLRLGQDQLRRNRPGEAERMFERAGDNAWAQLHLARLMIRDGRANEALTLLDRLMQRYPQTMRAVQMKSWAYEQLGDEEQAARYRQTAQHSLQLVQPHFPNTQRDEEWLHELGSAPFHIASGRSHAAGDVDLAIAAGEQAVSLYWREVYALHLAQLCRRRSPDRAIELLTEFNQRAGPTVLSLEMLGDSWASKGIVEKAREFWEQATDYRGSQSASMIANLSVHTKLARLASRQGDEEKARRHEGLAHYERGKLAWRDNRLQDAKQSFAQAVQLVEDHAPSWFYLGQTRRLLGDADAKDAYERCLKLDPHHGRGMTAVQD